MLYTGEQHVEVVVFPFWMCMKTYLLLLQHADLVFWPIALDIKYKDVEAMPDGHIDVTLFNGAIRNSENEHMAKLLRQKTKILVAYGSCAHMGGIPGLANFSNKEEIFKRAYIDSESTVNPDKIFPQPHVQCARRKFGIAGISTMM